MEVRDLDQACGSTLETVESGDGRKAWRTPLVRRIEALDAQGGTRYHGPDLFTHLHS